MRHLFADTNVHLHFKRFDDRCWASLVGEGGAVVAVPSVTVRELDIRKGDRHIRIRKRAREAVSWLLQQRGRQRQPIQPGLQLATLPTEPTEAFERYPELDRSTGDDRFIASVLQFRDSHPEDTVEILSSDAGVLLKADHFGVPAQVPPESCRLPETKTEEERELSKLRRRIAEVQGAQPDLMLSFQDGSKKSEALLGPPAAEIEVLIAARREAERFNRTRNLTTVTQQGAVASYLQRFEGYLAELRPTLLQLSRMCALELSLHNDGTGPGDDVQIFLEWDVDARLVENVPKFPKPPKPPRVDLSPFGLGMNLPDTLLDHPSLFIPDVFGREPDVDGPYACSQPRCAKYTIKRIHQRLSIDLARLMLLVEADEAVQNFQLRWQVIAANAPGVRDGKLHVVITSGRSLEACCELVERE